MDSNGISSYAAYHARCWAEGQTDDALRSEIARCEDVSHNYGWGEVGSRHLDWSRAETLKEILRERDMGSH